MKTILFDLDFQPQQKSEDIFPLFLWQNWALNHFDQKAQSQGDFSATHDLSQKDFCESFKKIYKELSLMELARFYGAASKTPLINTIPWEKFFRLYSYNWNERLQKIMSLALLLPPSFQQWMLTHSCSPRDIEPLLSLKDTTLVFSFLENFTQLKLSRNQGAQLLELSTELHLMGHDWSELLPLSHEDINSWLQRLQILRYPLTHELDQSAEKLLTELPWTKQFSSRWVRQGDRSGLEVKFLALSPNDLKNKLKSLNEIVEGLK